MPEGPDTYRAETDVFPFLFRFVGLGATLNNRALSQSETGTVNTKQAGLRVTPRGETQNTEWGLPRHQGTRTRSLRVQNRETRAQPQEPLDVLMSSPWQREKLQGPC